MRRTSIALLAALACHACSAPVEPRVDVREGCVLDSDPAGCLLPWPSSELLVADEGTRTGHRLDIPQELMPVNDRGVPVSTEAWNRWDGFSAMTSMLARFPGRIDEVESGLPRWRDPASSTGDSSPTIVYDATHGRRLEHFAETTYDEESDRTHFFIRPAERLPDEAHIVVAIRGLVRPDGSAVSPIHVFAPLRDGTAAGPILESRRARYERDVFGPLEANAGVDRGALIVAWDFWTASGESAWGDLVAMRDAAAAPLDAGTLGCAIVTVEDVELEGAFFRTVEGTFEVPLFLESEEPGALLRRDGDGLPIATGTATHELFAMWPRSIESAGDASVPVMLYGHGLFSDRHELRRDFGAQTLARGEMIGISTDLRGLTESDLPVLIPAISEASGFTAIVDRVAQSVIAHLVLPRVFAGRCASAPELSLARVVDPDALVYAGNSQGAIIGPTLAALSPDIERYALGVGGIAYSTMIPRASGFATLDSLLEGAYPSRIERDLAMIMFQHHWDRFEGAAFAPHVFAERLAGSPERAARLLYQVAQDDTSSPTVGSEMAARTMDLPVLASSALEPWGLEPAGTSPTSAYVVYDYEVTPPPEGMVRSRENGVHELVRRDPRAQDQIVRFLHEGTIPDTCEPACTAP